jgi:tetrahydromethanopterin S-methyltransferase subunit B
MKIKPPKHHPSIPAKIEALTERIIELSQHQVLTGESVDRIDLEIANLQQILRDLSVSLRPQPTDNAWGPRVKRWLRGNLDR